MTGISTSAITTSGSCASRNASASRPSRAVSTRNPEPASASAVTSRTSGSSSTRSTRPRSASPIPPNPSPPPEVIVGPVEPILPGRAEDVDAQRVLERLRSVGEARGQHENPACPHDPLFPPVVAQPEAQGALQHVGDLLVLVEVHGHDAALLQIDVGEHDPLGG